jgi:hypothetical protein
MPDQESTAQHQRPRQALSDPSGSVQPVYGVFDPDYARFFTQARCIAWSEGYALCVHGSFTRDLDVIAIPWIEYASHRKPEDLIRRITWGNEELALQSETPTVKEHGRLCWTITFTKFGDPRWVDFSIIPSPKDQRVAPPGSGQPDNQKGNELP